MLHIHPTSTPLKDAYTALNAVLEEAQGKDILLLLSGGSALALVEHISLSLLGAHVTISVLDERWTYEKEDSNYAQLTSLPCWKNIQKSGAQCIDPRPRRPEDLQDTAMRFDLALKHWHITHRDGIVIVTMGIGPDGHTAGVLPFPNNAEIFEPLFEHTSTCIRGYTVPPEQNPHTKRMTATITYVKRHVDHAIVYAVGKNKQDALTKIEAREGTLADTPALVLHDMRDGHLYIEKK